MIRVNATTAFLVTAGLMVAALVAGGWFAALILLTLAAGVVAVLVRRWPQLALQGRIARLVVLGVLVTLAAVRLRG